MHNLSRFSCAFALALYVALPGASLAELTNDFSFARKLDVPPLVLVTSDSAQIIGIQQPVTIALALDSANPGSSSQYCISSTAICAGNNSCDVQSWTKTSSLIGNNQFVCLRHISAEADQDQMSTIISVDGTLAGFDSYTKNPLLDLTPNPFGFHVAMDVLPSTQVVSNPVKIGGINGPSDIFLGGLPSSEYCISSASDCIGPSACDVLKWTNLASTVLNGQNVCVRHISSPIPGEETKTRITIHSRYGEFVAYTGAIAPPPPPPPNCGNGTPCSPTFNITDVWWDPNESGWGLSLFHNSNSQTVVGAWYVYDSNGDPAWFTFGGNGWTSATTFHGVLYRSTGPSYDVPFQSNLVKSVAVGTVDISFDSATHGAATFSINGLAIKKSLTRVTF